MLRIDPATTQTADLHQYLLGAVAPRPICFASTVNENGQPNLAPYSFFNVYSSNPPIAIFSSNRKVKDNRTKHTLHNVETTGEVVINVVTYPIVRQMALTSIEYNENTSEFDKGGFTPIASEMVKPFRVKESPVQMECKVQQIMPLGNNGGAGNLIICKVVLMHINPAILDEEQKIDPYKIDLMGRMGRAFYCRANGDSISKIFQPVNVIGIGMDALPEPIRTSSVLTGNELAEMASLPQLPSSNKITEMAQTSMAKDFVGAQQYAKTLIANGEKEQALSLLIAASKS